MVYPTDTINRQLVSLISYETWDKIADWGKNSGCLSLPDQNTAINLAHKVKFDYELNRHDIAKGIILYEIVCRNNYEIFEKEITNDITDNIVSKEQVVRMLTWKYTPIILENWQFIIVEQAFKDNRISKFRAAELLSINKQLKDHGLY